MMRVMKNVLEGRKTLNNNNNVMSKQMKKTTHQSIIITTQRAHFSQTLLEKKLNKVVILSGLTGLGKTVISLEIAKKMKERGIKTEIISNDAVQVYKGLDIGTYKVSKYEREVVPHHLVDIYNPSDVVNAGDFFDLAVKKIDEVIERGNVPIIVGATTYYIQWLLFGKQGGPVVPRHLERKYYQLFNEDNDWDKSYQRLVEVDEVYAKKVSRNDYHRLCRALAKIELTGKPLHELNLQSSKSRNDFAYDFRPFYLIRPKMDCKRIIDYRVELMLQSGFISEVAKLMKNGFKKEDHASRAIGYQSTMQIIQSDKPIDSSLVLDWLYEIQSNTRQAARNQLKYAKLGELGECWRWVDMQHYSTNNSTFQNHLITDGNTINSIADVIIDNLKLTTEEHNSEEYKAKFPRPNYLISDVKEFRDYHPQLRIYNRKQKIMELIYEFTNARRFVFQNKSTPPQNDGNNNIDSNNPGNYYYKAK